MSKIKNGGLDQYGAGPFEQQQFGTAGVEGVNFRKIFGEECPRLSFRVGTSAPLPDPRRTSHCETTACRHS